MREREKEWRRVKMRLKYRVIRYGRESPVFFSRRERYKNMGTRIQRQMSEINHSHTGYNEGRAIDPEKTPP